MLLRHLLGLRLRELRLAAGLSLRALAERSSVSVAHLSEIERGRAEASSEVLAAICAALGITVLELLASIVQVPAPARPQAPQAYMLAA